MKTLLLVDYSNLLYKSIHVHPGLSFAGKPTGGIYGFISQLTNLIDIEKPKKVIVCKDSKPYFRYIAFHDYKSDRKEKDEEFSRTLSFSIEKIDRFLSLLGIPILDKQGYEADDLIALMIERFESRYDRIVIASSDTDLYQLFRYQKSTVVMAKGKNKYYDRKSFQDDFGGISPKEWHKALALSGGHNGVPGFKGIGIKTALKLLAAGQEAIVDKIGSDALDTYDRNVELAHIPFERFCHRSPIRVRCSPENYSERKIIRFFARLGINLTSKMRRAFDLIT
jgi:DNA polymerase-1